MNGSMSLLLAMVSFAVLAKAGAATVLIDFGIDTQQAAGPCNHVSYAAGGSGVTTGAVALSDTSTAPTGWTITAPS